MVERFELQPRDRTIADEIPFEAGRRRHAGFRKAERVTMDALHTEAIIFRDILDHLFADEVVNSMFDGQILVGHAINDGEQKIRVTVDKDEKSHLFKVAASQDEYEWLTSGLGASSWREADRDAGRLLGRYYRLSSLTTYVLDFVGEVDVEAEAFRELPIGTDKQVCIKGVSEQDVHDIAIRRLAGALAIDAMGLPEDTSEAMRIYLAQTLEDRIYLTASMIKFANVTGGKLPKDYDVDIVHWKGVCTPLASDEVKGDGVFKLWKPSR